MKTSVIASTIKIKLRKNQLMNTQIRETTH